MTASGNDFVVRHPVVFHLGSETVNDATLKLHGQSSWAQTAMLDGNRAKIQFDISFHQSDPNGKFHGIEKLVFDMPRSDWTFMHDRLAHAWLRQVGIAAGCAANARVEINGSYYGMYVAEENTNKRVIAEFFPNSPSGGLWKGAIQPETGLTTQAANQSRQATFTQATDLAQHHGDRRRLVIGRRVGQRGAAQQRRRDLRRQPQPVHLRSGGEGVRLSAE